jgi:2-oxoglutarate dehydrogenase E2 component (dihydrolipoamide succinyltransferase)
MAESISEGTLKGWSKQVGDFVEVDEEIATIETDKVGLALCAILPAAVHNWMSTSVHGMCRSTLR